MRSLIASAGLCFLVFGSSPARAARRQHSKAEANLARIGRRDITKGDLDLYSPRREIEIGKEMAQRIEELVTPLDDPSTDAYVQGLADLIVRHSDARVPVQVGIIYSNQVSAFALPGGFLFVTTGLILQTRSEAELAGVLAHEVAHIADRDATRQMTQADVLKWMSLPLLYFGGPAGFAIRGSIAIAGPLSAMVFSRHAEERADFLGLQYLYKSGYDPEGYVDFFERVKKLEKAPDGMMARAFASHPLTKDRIVAAEREIQKDLPPRAEYVVTTSSYQDMRNRLVQMMRDEMTVVPYLKPKAPVLKTGFAAKHPPWGGL
ncbi:MAG TPA: M48 family metalloprotease [Patescibacteria group bacterium]|nr:M48 family metalloprotease [Patescibacteria group bacterium]